MSDDETIYDEKASKRLSWATRHGWKNNQELKQDHEGYVEWEKILHACFRKSEHAAAMKAALHSMGDRGEGPRFEIKSDAQMGLMIRARWKHSSENCNSTSTCRQSQSSSAGLVCARSVPEYRMQTSLNDSMVFDHELDAAAKVILKAAKMLLDFLHAASVCLTHCRESPPVGKLRDFVANHRSLVVDMDYISPHGEGSADRVECLLSIEREYVSFMHVFMHMNALKSKSLLQAVTHDMVLQGWHNLNMDDY